MTRTLRGLWSRRGTLLPLFLLTAVVVAGVVAVLGFADHSGTSSAVAVPLVLLGMVAVPTTGRELASVRRGEVALARLRGITGGQLFALLAVEPLMVLVAGALVGTAAGAVVAGLAGRLWLGIEGAGIGVSALPAVLVVVLAGLVAVLAGMAGGLREPLVNQVSVSERPRAASTAALFGSVLVIVGAAVAVYRSSVAAADDADIVVLAGPALVGLAVGQAVLWLLRLGARLGVGLTAHSPLPRFLAVRRLARVAEVGGPVRLVVAAAVVGAVAFTGSQQVGSWTDGTARLRMGAPVRVTLEGDAREALDLTRRLDPEGRWLMAAVLVPGEGSIPARRAYLDTARYETVVGDFLSDTPADGLSRSLERLVAGTPDLATGDAVRATVQGVSTRRSGSLRPRVTVTYLNDEGRSASTTLRFRIGLDGAAVTAERAVEDCSGGCVVTGLTLDRTTGDAPLPWLLTGLEVGGRDVVDRTWTPERQRLPFGVPPVEIVSVSEGLLAPVSDEPLVATTSDTAQALRVLATDSATWGTEPREVDSPGGDERPAEVVARFGALPLVEADGLLADLPRALVGAPPTVPAAQVMVLARDDTPDRVLAALVASAGQQPDTLDGVAAMTDDQVGGVQAHVYALMAAFCLAVAVLAVATSASRERRAHGRQLAAMRLVGVPRSQVGRAGATELMVLAGAALAAATVGSVVAVRLLLANLALVTVPVHAAPLEIGLSWAPILGAGLVVVAVVVVVGRHGRSVRAGVGTPASLREDHP